ncbi:DUF397 domain-containing protein [Solwaraspora sp. WMMD792]|uniref:DUF397 domain-containing protein n=1 Tax=Solwaraspora sp. WMMD792 TaxID=3016099 RepID=UPI002417E3C0|nr:DUF397 domain-containing protein [Solwaraspora sp. WMMD792]MDG4775163.1 DUF397 domain-containing protein [Solwaraspora sp. WMMD792]
MRPPILRDARCRAVFRSARRLPLTNGSARRRVCLRRTRGGPVPQSPPPPSWRKSSRSGSGECVEVARTETRVHVRDSKTRDHSLQFDHERWRAFLSSL